MPQRKSPEDYPFAIMDGSLCYDRYANREAAEFGLKQLRAQLAEAVSVAEQDLEDHDENMKVEETK